MYMPYGHILSTGLKNCLLVYESHLYKIEIALANNQIKGGGK